MWRKTLTILCCSVFVALAPSGGSAWAADGLLAADCYGYAVVMVDHGGTYPDAETADDFAPPAAPQWFLDREGRQLYAVAGAMPTDAAVACDAWANDSRSLLMWDNSPLSYPIVGGRRFIFYGAYSPFTQAEADELCGHSQALSEAWDGQATTACVWPSAEPPEEPAAGAWTAADVQAVGLAACLLVFVASAGFVRSFARGRLS